MKHTCLARAAPIFALAIALAAALPQAAAAQTRERAKNDAAEDARARAELDRAQAELARASERVAELSIKLGEDQRRIAIDRVRMRRPIVGVVIAAAPEAGARLAAVTPDGPAARAGLRTGDVLTHIDGKAIAGATPEARADKARDLLGELEDGQRVELGYTRAGKAAKVKVKATSMPRVFVWSGDGDGYNYDYDYDFDFDFDFDKVMPRQELAKLRRQLEVEVPKQLRHLEVVVPEIGTEIAKIAPMIGCGKDDKDCRVAMGEFPMLAQAFRWSGLNLASVDPKLGRYFGTDRGVLVLGGNEDLKGLEPGDVILAIDGKAVDTPREAMRALRGKTPGAKIDVQVQRDRARRTLALTAPEARAFRFLPPHVPPNPPAPPTPPTPPEPPEPPAVPAPPAPPPAPPGAEEVQA